MFHYRRGRGCVERATAADRWGREALPRQGFLNAGAGDVGMQRSRAGQGHHGDAGAGGLSRTAAVGAGREDLIDRVGDNAVAERVGFGLAGGAVT